MQSFKLGVWLEYHWFFNEGMGTFSVKNGLQMGQEFDLDGTCSP